MCEIAEVYCTKIRKAKKPHICCECGQTIIPGQEYRYDSGILDHEPFVYKRCLDCYALLEFIYKLPETDCIDVPIFDYLKECDYVDGTISLVPWVKRKDGAWRLVSVNVLEETPALPLDDLVQEPPLGSKDPLGEFGPEH
jgi:hypothetical protein